MRAVYLATVALLLAACSNATPTTNTNDPEADKIIDSSSPVTAPSGWFFLHPGESYTGAENKGLGVTLIGLDLKTECRDSGCYSAGSATAAVDRESATAPQPVYSQVEAQHFTALDDKTIVDFSGAASEPTSGTFAGTFRLRAIAASQVGVLGSAYPLAATRPIHYPGESLTVRLSAVEFDSVCPCDDPCGTMYCMCLLGTSVTVTVLLETANAFGVVVVPGNFGGYQVDFGSGNGLDPAICYAEVPYQSTVSILISKP